jgi:thioredoxin reductase
MEQQDIFDVIIIGGSYAGLSAALSLGRASRKVLVIDSGNPCNRQTPHSHNFLTNDGSKPAVLHQKAQAQVECYPTVSFLSGTAADVIPQDALFEVVTEAEEHFTARKILFATGVIDTIPNIEGFANCWGISILHCPYCHGYEIKNQKAGILGNGDMAFELAKTISHWTKSLTLYTNGTSTLNPEQVRLLNKHNIIIVENEVDFIEHEKGYITKLHFNDTEPEDLQAIFTQLPFIQQCPIPERMGCEMTDKGFIHINKCLETSIPGVYAAGDCLSLFRSVANAVASGNKVGAMINKQFIEEDFSLLYYKLGF